MHNCGYPDSHGVNLRHFQVGGLEVFESRHQPGMVLDWHYHSSSCATYIYEGGYSERYRGREFDCERGSILVKPRGEKHQDYYSDHGARSVVIRLSEAESGEGSELNYDGGPLLLCRPDIVSLGHRLREELLAPDNISGLIVEGAARQIIGESLRKSIGGAKPSCPDWLGRVCEKIHDQFQERLDLKELAVVAGVHPDHLSRTFRLHFGVLIGDYIRGCRLDWAREQLHGSVMPIAEIALAAGFSDQSHFTRNFKRRYSRTPAEFRRLRS